MKLAQADRKTRILDYLAASPGKRVTANEIAAGAGCPESSVVQLMRLLVGEKKVGRRAEKRTRPRIRLMGAYASGPVTVFVY